MNIKRTLVLTGATLTLLLIGDAPRHAPGDPWAPFGLQLVSEAHAVFGMRRRTARRWAVVGASAGAARASAAYSQQAAPPPQQATAAPQPATAPAPAGGNALPLGTVAQSLPQGCTTSPAGGVQYYHCGADYYRAVMQGNSLVYVTARP